MRTKILSFYCFRRSYSTKQSIELKIKEKCFERDNFTNVTPRILELLSRKLYSTDGHPLLFVTQKISDYFHNTFRGKQGNPIFSVHQDLDQIVTTYQNFDSLLVPKDHVSRGKSDCYYLNKDVILRSHMTAHQSELIKMGLDNFLMVGDVYRRDDIDSKHYPCFHQLDGVKLFTPQELFYKADDGVTVLSIMKKDGENLEKTDDCQAMYSLEASKKVETHLKETLEGLAQCMFGSQIEYQWVDAYFPFTHPSWELEIKLDGQWLEVLGCGVVQHGILKEAGCENRIGWAFGLGLERLAMILYKIPDIRIFWSRDSGFLNQFAGKTFRDEITYQQISRYPQCVLDISFWIPETFSSRDFYDLARDAGGDYVEQIHLIDEFKHPKTGRRSHCYRIIYRHMEKTLTNEEASDIHMRIADVAVKELGVENRSQSPGTPKGK